MAGEGAVGPDHGDGAVELRDDDGPIGDPGFPRVHEVVADDGNLPVVGRPADLPVNIRPASLALPGAVTVMPAGSAAKSIEYATGDRRFVMSLSLVAVFAVAHRKITRGITAVLSDGWAAADDAGRGLAVEHRTRTVRVILDAAMAVGRSAAQQRRAGDRRRRAQSSTQP